MRQPRFLPMSGREAASLGWDRLDILLVSGDAYVDHPSFGVALLGRFLVSRGFRVGIVAQPRWENPEEALADMTAMGRPRLFVGVAAGAIDSMLAHYTAFRKKRSDDAYTPGGLAGARPNRACIVYTGLARRAFPGIPVILGGIEASLRRISHYDFWSDSLRRSILLDSKADLLIYGMGETSLAAVAGAARNLLESNGPSSLHGLGLAGFPGRADLVRASSAVPGLVWSGPLAEAPSGPATAPLPSHEAMQEDSALLLRATLELESQVHQGGRVLVQAAGDRFTAVNPPAAPLSGQELDALYGLPFSRLPHPSYTQPIPAWEMIRTSITTHRGCAGGCSFCSLALHQGRRIASRGKASILAEARRIAEGPDAGSGPFAPEGSGGTPHAAPPRWAGAISDVGGPSANMWRARCTLPEDKLCSRSSCLHPAICSFFSLDQGAGVDLLRSVAAQEGVRHVRVASGVRFDLALQDAEALRAYTDEFTGGQLKVAPEHSETAVLDLMRKPSMAVFESFLQEFARHTGRSGKELYAVPYLMSAFPGCTEEGMRNLAAWLREKRWKPQQVQCFIPTPGTVATAMYYAGTDAKGRPLHVAKTDRERLRQHHILLGDNPDGERASARGGGRTSVDGSRGASAHSSEEGRRSGGMRGAGRSGQGKRPSGSGQGKQPSGSGQGKQPGRSKARGRS